MNSIGIVLKSHTPQHQKISLFDQEKGHIIGIIHERYIPSATIITYMLQPAHRYFFLKDIALFDMPLIQAHEHLLFIHQVIECVYYFLPEHQSCTALFEAVLLIYTFDLSTITEEGKLLFLCKLFCLLGFHVPAYSKELHLLDQLLYSPIDVLLQREVEPWMRPALNQWLTDCIAQHPQAHIFRTYHVLK